MFQILFCKYFLFVLCFILNLTFSLSPLNSNTKSFNYTYDCSYLFSEKPCNLLNLTFAKDVFSNSVEEDLEKINDFIEESYIFKRKFTLNKESNDTSLSDYKMILSEDFQANESIAVFFSEEEVLHSRSLGRSYMHSFKEVDAHVAYPKLEQPFGDIDVSLILLYHLYHINHSKFSRDLRLLPRLIQLPAVSFSEYELNLLEENTFPYNSTINIRKILISRYQILSRELKIRWSREEIMSFLNGREEIPLQDFVYAFLVVQSKMWTSTYEKRLFVFLVPVFMHLKYDDNFFLNKTKIKRILTGRDLYSTKIINTFEQKEFSVLKNDIFESKSEHFLLMNSFVPKRNDFDCVNIRVLPEYVAKDWMKDSTGEECFDRFSEATILNYHMVALHMNLDEEEQYKCEIILGKHEDLDIPSKQDLVLKSCPFSGYKKVDLWNQTFITIEKELKPEYKEKIKMVRDYIKVRKSLGLDTRNGELIKKLWEGKIALIDDIKKIMKQYRDYSIKKIKASQEAKEMSFEKKFTDQKIEL